MNRSSRIGIGYDIHKTDKERDLIIGGVKIPHTMGLLGHSDADVLIHAIIDAILGALALPDIGTLFPDNDPQYKNISSVILLEKVRDLLLEKGYEINNIDSNIIAQEPKTNEKMDAVGRLESIETNAIVMLTRIDN